MPSSSLTMSAPPPLQASTSEEDDAVALQVALAEAQLQARKHLAGNTADETSTTAALEHEVLYNNGATPLFTVIEERKWFDAMELLEVVPEQAATWVKSTGTENTTFGWSLWRRLPIHEACRRQPPAWFIAALLKAYPESVRAQTHFGMLPLHCAVECGAAPEIVNLLLVNYYEGIHVRDASGRTPMQIVQKDDVMINVEDHQYVQGSLRSAHANLDRVNDSWQRKLDELKKKQEQDMANLSASHQKILAQEREFQLSLQNQIQELENHVAHFQNERRSLEKTLTHHTMEKEEWYDLLERKKLTVDELTDAVKDREVQIADFQEHSAVQDKEIASLCDRIAVLEADLINITVLQRESIEVAAKQAEEDVQVLLVSQHALQGQLQGQRQGLEMLLRARGITLPELKVDEEQEDEQPGVFDDGDLEEVANEAAMAAIAAILKAETEVFEKVVYDELTSTLEQQQSMAEEKNAQEEKEEPEDDEPLQKEELSCPMDQHKHQLMRRLV